MKVLVVNCGSSSLKYQLFDMETEKTLASGLADRVGVNGGTQGELTHKVPGRENVVQQVAMGNHTIAADLVLKMLADEQHGVIANIDEIGAVGHRVLHGGPKISGSVIINEEIIEAIEEAIDFGPLHNPANLMGIAAVTNALPGVPQVAVFDTSFGQNMPLRAHLYALPWEYYEKYGIRRYGFHGTSHRYITQATGKLLEEAGIPFAEQKIVTTHLGNGSSMSAVKGGKCIDTSMGLTPLEGLIMGTRCGSIDPAIVPYIMEKFNLNPKEMDTLMNKQSGFLGVSGFSSDMRDIRDAAAEGNERAKACMEVLTYRIKKYIGAYAAAMGGLDAIVFTGGIGENEWHIRHDSVENLGFLGVEMDEEKNSHLAKDKKGVDISTPASNVRIYVIPTDEELMIARDTAEIVS